MILPNVNEAIMDEIWLPISPIFIPNIAPIYTISTYGRVYNSETGNFLPQNIMYNKDKYITICLKYRNGEKFYQMPHRLTMMIFNYRPDYNLFDVNHRDGIKYHNWLWNLEWVTKSENIQHAINNDLFNLGETRGNTKLSNEQARYICELLEQGKSNSDISKIIHVEGCDIKGIARNIKAGLSWKHISKDYNF